MKNRTFLRTAGMFLASVFVVFSVLGASLTDAEARTTQTTSKATTVTFTNVVYSDVNGVKTTYKDLNALKASVKINALSNDMGKKMAKANMKTYAAAATTLAKQINAYRASLGLPQLRVDTVISTAAMHRAAESAYSNWNVTAYENGTVKRHIRPNLQKASSIASYYGITGEYGEDYARFFNTPESALAGWTGSPSHNAILTGKQYTKIGIGIAKASNGDYYWIALLN